jgi:heme iron utilization protein
MTVVSAHLNAGFARAADLKASDVLTDLTGADEMLAAEEGAVAHMNDDHADAVRLYAGKLLNARDGAWRVTGIDPDGMDLMLADATLRLPFPQRVQSASLLRQVLKRLADEARAKA